jgi:hypothetical protein
MAFHSKLVPASELTEFMAEARKRYVAGLAADADDRADAQDDQRFEHGGDHQWDPAALEARRNPKYPRPVLTENRIHIFVHQVANEGRQSKPSIVVTAGDGGKPETAEVIQSWIREVEYESDADIAYDNSREQQLISGRAWYRLNTEYASKHPGPGAFKQVPRVRPIENQFAVVWDPSAKRYAKTDADWIFIIGTTSKDKHKQKYGSDSALAQSNFALTPETVGWVNVGASSEELLEVEYWRKVHNTRRLCRLHSGAVVWKDEIQPAGMPAPDGTVYDDDPIEEERDEDDVTVQQFVIDALSILDETEWVGSDIPAIPVWGREEIVDGKRHTISLIRHGKTPQRLINLYVSNIAEQVALMPKNPYVVAEGQIINREQEWEEINTVPRAVIQYKPTAIGGTLAPPPQRNVNEPPIMALTAGLSQAVDALKASMGMFDPSLGARSNERSGLAIERRQRQSDNANFHFQDNEARSRKTLGRMLLELLANLNRGETIVTVRGEDGTTKRVPINQKFIDPDTNKETEHIIDPEAYVVSTGPSYTSSRHESFDKYSTLAQYDPRFMQLAGDILFRNMDVPGAQEISDRYEKMLPPQLQPGGDGKQPPLPPQIQQAMEQGKHTMMALSERVRELQNELDSKQPEIMARIRISEMQEETKRLQIQAELDIARLNAGVKTAVEEMKADMTSVRESIQTARADIAQLAAKPELPAANVRPDAVPEKEGPVPASTQQPAAPAPADQSAAALTGGIQ